MMDKCPKCGLPFANPVQGHNPDGHCLETDSRGCLLRQLRKASDTIAELNVTLLQSVHFLTHTYITCPCRLPGFDQSDCPSEIPGIEDMDSCEVPIIAQCWLKYFRSRSHSQTCHICGYTDDHTCHCGCSWIKEDLCDSCREYATKLMNINANDVEATE